MILLANSLTDRLIKKRDEDLALCKIWGDRDIFCIEKYMKSKCGFSHRCCSMLWMQINQHMQNKIGWKEFASSVFTKDALSVQHIKLKRGWTCN